MRVLTSGCGGLIGSAVVARLRDVETEVVALSRGASTDGLQWDPAAGRIDADALEGFDAVVHLAGEPISPPWTVAKRRRIRDSRVDGTRLLCEALAGVSRPPNVVVCASAVGFYGDRGQETLDESAPSGEGFLARVCRDWEAATASATAAGIRVVNLRLGVVISPRGGALKHMLTPFRLCLGGRIGSGRQYMSWISLDDCAAAALWVLGDETLVGPVNAVAPNPVTNAAFTRALAAAVHRPAWLPMPAWAARLLMGDFARETLLASTRAVPARLLSAGFAFQHPTVADGLLGV